MSYAGPSASRVGASAVVARLRRSVAWSDRRLAELSTLPQASATVAQSQTLVVDRRGLIRRVGAILDRFEDTRTPKVLAAEAIVLRALAKAATGIWDVTAGRRILVAPNVLADAQRYALDQTDWCRWVSLCTGLRGVHLTHAPHLVPYIADLMRSLPERSDELVRIVQSLEGGQAPLEATLTLWERGEALAERCSQILDGAQSRLTGRTQTQSPDER